MTTDEEDDEACQGLKPGQIVAFSHDDLPKPTYREVTPDNPPTLQALVVAVHDVRTLTLQPVVEDGHPITVEQSGGESRSVTVTVQTMNGPMELSMKTVGRVYECVPRYSRSSPTGDRRNTWQLIQ
jgi:hypothetical protein